MIIMAPLLVWLMSLAPGGGSLRLQYGWQPDAAYEQTMTMSSSVRLDLLGTAEGETAPQTLSRDLKYDVALTLVFDTGQRSNDGSLPFGCRLSKARGGTKDGKAIEAAGLKNLEGQKVARGRLLSSGRSIELEMEQMEGSAALPPDFKDRLLQSLPGRPMIGKLTITSKATYTLKEISRREARFDVTQRLSSAGSGQQVEAGGPAAGFTGGASGGRDVRLGAGSLQRHGHGDVGGEIAAPHQHGARLWSRRGSRGLRADPATGLRRPGESEGAGPDRFHDDPRATSIGLSR